MGYISGGGGWGGRKRPLKSELLCLLVMDLPLSDINTVFVDT